MFKRGSSDTRVLVNKLKSIGVYLLALGVFLASLVMILNNTSKYKRDVAVAEFREDVGSGTLIKKDMIQKRTLAERDYDSKTMVPYDQAASLIEGKYTGIYIPKGVTLQKTWFTDKKKERLKYLKDMKENQEFVTIPYDSRYSGGRVLLPGDYVKLYAVYQGTDPATGQLNKLADVDVIFKKIKVTDLLNAEEESVLGYLEDAQMLSREQQEALMKRKEFQDSLTPKFMGLVLTNEEAEALQKFLGNGKIQIKADILTRDENVENSNKIGSLLSQLQGGTAAPAPQADGAAQP
ncbi:hypothetical protein PM3016_353 [Paenibacillus mucilaginosus 3016]|uniref:SAF domain-containing protein n=1 Tax=Paenibacillus mucilaginosus 3016 TaxID=1116391 RepID=H6NRP7_9BACL|nr:hypothetical protein [Paenibacillus mucilaginosus]AFC27329.1 hypothetical protein PM3016_353 [Paenibacillus mucilaginosus 3016]WFA16241.1 hypothetical protein ERY13_01925 [Paenibacillus mucilaginosus]